MNYYLLIIISFKSIVDAIVYYLSLHIRRLLATNYYLHRAHLLGLPACFATFSQPVHQTYLYSSSCHRHYLGVCSEPRKSTFVQKKKENNGAYGVVEGVAVHAVVETFSLVLS